MKRGLDNKPLFLYHISTMNITNINDILTAALFGKVVSKQPRIPENCWGERITGIIPCDLNYGCDAGYLILTTGMSFTIDSNQSFGVDN